MKQAPGNDIILGKIAGRDSNLGISLKQRDKHLHICGGTGTGKTKFLENLIQQDIRDWPTSKCGMLVIDPHGNLYDSLIKWLAWTEYDRPIIPIDLRQEDWVVSYNLLRQRTKTDATVLVDNLVDAIAYVAGQDGTKQTPQFAQWAGNILTALYENKLTLVEAEHLLNRVEKQARYLITSDLKDMLTRQDWQLAETLTAKDYDAQIGSTVRRLRNFIKNPVLRRIFGQPKASLDFGKAIEEGSIILVSLATEQAKVSRANTDLFATLLLSDLWTAAQERGKRDGIKPFYIYLDEFQRFVTPTISENLDEARGFGLHLTLAHQFPRQLIGRGESGGRVFDSIMETASSKVVFRLQHRPNLEPMAEWLFMGTMNPDEIKHELYSTKVMEYREELKEVRGESTSSAESHGSQRGGASGAGTGGTQSRYENVDTNSSSESWSDFSSTSESENESWSSSKTQSKSYVPTIIPVIGKELTHVQFRSLEEQLHRAMSVLFDQQERQCVARLAGMKAPVSLVTPTVEETPGSPERTKKFLAKCYKKLPFALDREKAAEQLSDWKESVDKNILKRLEVIPATNKRRLK